MLADDSLYFIGGRACEGTSNLMGVLVGPYDDAIHLDVRVK